jgi:DNA helicase-2/ATP-dependent DNA helicase PcrA
VSDASVAALLRSDEPLVVIEAPAGCGKTFQGADYSRDVSHTLGQGRLLILTHTHGACGVFAERTRGVPGRVEIRTLDSLIGQVATLYRRALGLPENLTTWAYQNDGAGFEIMAEKVAGYLERHPIIRQALASRYPIIVCDEHQDASEAQHRTIMALRLGGARLRIFGDPLQAIFANGKSDNSMAAALAQWEKLKSIAAYDELAHPHRWEAGTPALGEWILAARTELKAGRPIPLSSPPVEGLRIVRADNLAPSRKAYQLGYEQRTLIDAAVKGPVMVLAASNERVGALSAFWGRRIPIWEGHTRSALADLVQTAKAHKGDADQLAQGFVRFASSIAGSGFSASSHGERLLEEVRNGCAKSARGKPGNIQRLARHLLAAPDHQGIALALNELSDLMEAKADGFGDIKVIHRSELRDAIRLKEFACPDEGYAEIARRRSHAMPAPPLRTLSTIHKAKGLECDNAVLIAGDRDQFTGTRYARCKLYVALSRAKRSLTIVVSQNNPSPLFNAD